MPSTAWLSWPWSADQQPISASGGSARTFDKSNTTKKERRRPAMFPELTILSHLFQILHARWQVLRADPEAGYSTETVVITALLVALAIGAVAVIASKVLTTANNINTGN
jgi:hypothetical protein